MISNKFSAMYYPAPMIGNQESIASLALLFDEIHLVTISDFAKSPTDYLRNLSSKISISVFGGFDNGRASSVGEFFAFAQEYKELIGTVLYYHPHVYDQLICQLSTKLIQGGAVPLDEFLDIIQGKSDELEAYNTFRKAYPNIDDSLILRVAPTALKLAKENDWVLVSDVETMPIPFSSVKNLDVKSLTSILAEECIKIALPKCRPVNAEQLMEIREKLHNQLVPFRFGMQKLTTGLRTAIKDAKTINEVKQECAFIAKSQIEPAIFDLQQKILHDNDKLIVKIFGKVLGWVPFVAKSFLAPTPDQIYLTLVKAYGDFGSIAESIQENAIIKEPGISYLFGVNSLLDNQP